MKKPMHWFACVIWVAAALYPVSVLLQLMLSFHGVTPSNMMNIFTAVRGTVYVFIQLAALAIIIEIADQIRWRGLPAEEQARSFEPDAFSRRLSQ